MSEETKDLTMVREHLEQLGEFFDAVCIFASRYESGGEQGTIHVNMGTGNYFTRIGQVRDWLIREDEVTRLGQRKDSE